MTTENNTENDASATETGAAQPETKAQSASDAANSAKNAAAGFLNTFLAQRESNPKVFYGSVGAVSVLLLYLIFGGGSDAKLPVHQSKPVVIGDSYVLKAANAHDPNATIRLVAVPGSMAAYDDTEENDREGGCKHIIQGTPVKVVQSQDAYGKKDVFVEVEMLKGECEGKKGWALAINLQ
jgi:hypothetical protein